MTFKVTPWEVEGSIDYEKLIRDFGTQRINQDLREEIKEIAKEDHVLLRRQVFFSHRDLDKVLHEYKEGKGFFLYTGRGPSGKMHIGHLIPFIFTAWLQKVFDVNVYIEITDDEKFVYNRKYKWEKLQHYANDNILDIGVVGFDPDKTFIFKDSEYIKHIYPLALEVARKITYSTAKAVFGFTGATNIGLIFYPSLQIVPTFFEKKRALIPCAIDQDPYWRIQRDIAESLGYYKAATIHSIFLPPLTGMQDKMSSSKPETAIFLDDDEVTVKRKVMKYAFSGGQPTIEEHRKKGGNPDIDVSFQWLYMFFEDDDKKVEEIRQEYTSGKMLTGELKQYLIDKINAFLQEHRHRREKKGEKAVRKMMYDGKLAKEMWKLEHNKIFEVK